MPDEENIITRAVLETVLQQPVLARIATTNPATLQPHVVPVWFLWDGASVWISAFDSTRKIKELKKNSLCSILVEPKESDGLLQAVLFEGEVELISEPRLLVESMTTKIYIRYLGENGVLAEDPQSWIHDPENLVIRMTPKKTYYW
jgi:general stress protein 26